MGIKAWSPAKVSQFCHELAYDIIPEGYRELVLKLPPEMRRGPRDSRGTRCARLGRAFLEEVLDSPAVREAIYRLVRSAMRSHQRAVATQTDCRSVSTQTGTTQEDGPPQIVHIPVEGGDWERPHEDMVYLE